MLKKLHRFAEAVAALLLAVIFVSFIVQIALRYLFNWRVGWTTELSLVAWLWLGCWGAGVVVRGEDEIRIDFVSANVGPRGRRIISALAAISLIVLFGMSL